MHPASRTRASSPVTPERKEILMSSNFSQVQFIGYAVSTKPAFCPTSNDADLGNRKYYLGDADSERDIEQRLDLLAKAVSRAQNAFTQSPDVFKVFVIPEFFFRGAYGAYTGKDIEARLQDRLGKLLAEFGASIDMALWGSTILAEKPLDLNNPAIKNACTLGDEYLHVYETCRDFRTNIGKATPTVRDILFELDVLEDPATRTKEPEQDPLAAVMEQLLRGCDRSAPVTVSNKCQITLGRDRCLTVQKQFKSCVDFVLNYHHDSAKQQNNKDCYLQTFVKYPPIAQTGSEDKQHDLDQYCIFAWKNLKIGVEICLDHIRGRLSKLENNLDLQIIPSCGAEVTPGFIAARAGGYVFNCDGDYTLEDAQNGADAHTQLYRVEKGGDPASGMPAQLGSRIAPAQILPVEFTGIERIFPKGAGELHVYAPARL